MADQQRNEPQISVSIKEAERLTSLSRTTLWRMEKDGKLQTAKIGRRRLVIMASLAAIIAANGKKVPEVAA